HARRAPIGVRPHNTKRGGTLMPPYPSRGHRRSIRLPGYDYTQPGAYFVTFCTYQAEELFGQVVNGVMVLNAYGEIAQREWLASAAIRREIALDAFVIMPNHGHAVVWILPDDAQGGMPFGRTPSGRTPFGWTPFGWTPFGRTPFGRTPFGRTPSAPTVDLTGRTPSGWTPFGRTPSAPTVDPTGRTPSGRTPSAPTVQRSPKSLGALMAGYKSAVTRQINILRNTPGLPVWQRNYYEHIIRTERALNAIRQYILDNPARWHLDKYNAQASAADPLAAELWRMLEEETL
ncbi:MAG: transposase, partial [Anaerolineae bacterium]